MAYGRKWKPNASQKIAYAEKMKEAEEQFSFIRSSHPIRQGCFVEWVDKTTNEVFSGTVSNSSYGFKTMQHTYTILREDGTKKMVKGRNLYDRLLKHDAGDIAKDSENPLNKKERSN